MLILSFTFITSAVIASADKGYAINNINSGANVTGSFYQAITRPLSAIAGGEIIAHAQWVHVGPTNSTICTGFRNGYENGNYVNGFFRSYTKYDSNGNFVSFSSYNITGPSTATGTNHTYQIQRTSSSSWNVYIDYVDRGSFSCTSTCVQSGIEIGLYSGHLNNTSDVWNENSFQYCKNNTWSYWSVNDPTWITVPWVGYIVNWDVMPTSIFSSTD